MLTKIFLTLIGLLYLGLAIWCAYDPKTTSSKIGFELVGGSGKSEFLTVYGGLELGLALILLMPLFRHDWEGFALTACFLVHLSLVVFRTSGFFMFSDIGRMTYQLAIGEWVILLLSAGLMFWKR